MTCTSLRSGMASKGVRVSAQIAPAMPKMVRMITKKALRALASMTRSSRKGLGGTGLLDGWITGLVGSDIRLPGFESALDLCFGINEEIRAGDNSLAFLHSRLHFVDVTVFAAEFDET